MTEEVARQRGLQQRLLDFLTPDSGLESSIQLREAGTVMVDFDQTAKTDPDLALLGQECPRRDKPRKRLKKNRALHNMSKLV
jgi:hypothetical protein